MLAQFARCRLIGLNQGGQIAALAARAQHPARRALGDARETRQQIKLQAGINLVIQRIDLVPQRFQVKNLACQREGTNHVSRCGTCFRSNKVDESRAGAIDHRVGHEGGDDLAPERVSGNGRCEFLAQRFREVGSQHALEIGIVGQVAGQQLIKHGHLGVSQQHRVFRCTQTCLVCLAPGDFLVGRQEFDGPVQVPITLQPLQQALLAVEQVLRSVRGNVKRLCLVVVVGQHQQADLIGHGSQQVVALLQGQVTGLDHAAEQDLDIDLMIRAIDPSRIVDCIGIDQATLLRKLDAAVLRATQVAAFCQHLAAQFVTVDAKRITRLVTDLGVTLKSRLDVGADAAVVEQVHRRQQNRPQQFSRRQLFGLYADDGARLGAQAD